MIGLLSLCLTACAEAAGGNKDNRGKSRAPELVPCERVADEDLADNGQLWELKNQAINLLDTCADQVDAQIKRSQSK